MLHVSVLSNLPFLSPYSSLLLYSQLLTEENHCLHLLTVLPDVRIPEREERRLPKQCNSQKEGSLLLTRIRAPAAGPTQWYGIREP